MTHRFTHAGSPSHKSQIRGRPLAGWSDTTPNGQASAQAGQTMHASTSRTIAAVSSRLDNAPAGQAARHGASAQKRQRRGRSMPSGSSFCTLIRAVAIPNRPSWIATHATSHARQPLQRVSLTRTCFTTSPALPSSRCRGRDRQKGGRLQRPGAPDCPVAHHTGAASRERPYDTTEGRCGGLVAVRRGATRLIRSARRRGGCERGLWRRGGLTPGVTSPIVRVLSNYRIS